MYSKKQISAENMIDYLAYEFGLIADSSLGEYTYFKNGVLQTYTRPAAFKKGFVEIHAKLGPLGDPLDINTNKS